MRDPTPESQICQEAQLRTTSFQSVCPAGAEFVLRSCVCPVQEIYLSGGPVRSCAHFFLFLSYPSETGLLSLFPQLHLFFTQQPLLAVFAFGRRNEAVPTHGTGVVGGKSSCCCENKLASFHFLKLSRSLSGTECCSIQKNR